jgi:hypothetical protein
MSEAEDEAVLATATPVGGRALNESLDRYVERSRQKQEEALERYYIARQQYRAHGGGKT